jgi:hypothetical protein
MCSLLVDFPTVDYCLTLVFVCFMACAASAYLLSVAVVVEVAFANCVDIPFDSFAWFVEDGSGRAN